MADPVSWLLIEKGWLVVDPSGARVGKVDEVLGDTNLDIFDGIAVETHLFRKVEVPAEEVLEITEGRVVVAGRQEAGVAASSAA